MCVALQIEESGLWFEQFESIGVNCTGEYRGEVSWENNWECKRIIILLHFRFLKFPILSSALWVITSWGRAGKAQDLFGLNYFIIECHKIGCSCGLICSKVILWCLDYSLNLAFFSGHKLPRSLITIYQWICNGCTVTLP